MNTALVDRIVNAVLYEGYILYPYRPSVKNTQRWTFGGLFPQAYGTAHPGSDGSMMQTECLVRGGPDTLIGGKVRFLHLMSRTAGELAQAMAVLPPMEPAFRPVETLHIGDQQFHTWQEAVEREVVLEPAAIGGLLEHPRQVPFAFPPARSLEGLRDSSGQIVGLLLREQQGIEGVIEVSACAMQIGLYRFTVTIRNCTPMESAAQASRDEALMHSMASTHTILHAAGGAFVSLMEPPPEYQSAAATCNNIGTWPVLVGENSDKDAILSSPIILYDYPQIAPESPGDLFDGTEIDELLSLRVMALTDEEKRSMAAVDQRARAVLQRTESLRQEQLARLHGTIRELRPASPGGAR